MGFEHCYRCAGQAETTVVIGEFIHGRNGHVRCTDCRITFDTNVDDVEELVSVESIVEIDNERVYRDQFGEASKIRTDDEDYAQFGWADQAELRSGVAAPVVATLADHLESSVEPLRILDVGAGSGFTSAELADHFTTAHVTAVDPSPQVHLVDGYGKRVEALQGTLGTLPLSPSSFDAVVVVGNLMLHLNPLETLERAIALTRPGGILVFDFKNIDASARTLSIAFARFGVARFLPRRLFERNFRNMRFGFNASYLTTFMERFEHCQLVQRLSKPPRLLAFENKSDYSAGVTGVVWRALDKVDDMRDEQAWIQLAYRVGVSDSDPHR